MKNIVLHVLFILAILFSSCTKEDDTIKTTNNQGELILKPHLWSVVSKCEYVEYNLQNTNTNMYYENTIITVKKVDNNYYLSCYNSIDGNMVWQKDITNIINDIGSTYTYNYFLVYTLNNSIEVIDMRNGETIANHDFGMFINKNSLVGFNNLLYIPDEYISSKICIYDLHSLSVTDTISIDYIPYNNLYSFLNNFSKNGENYLLHGYSKTDNESLYMDEVTYISLYNITQNKWIYNKKFSFGYCSSYSFISDSLFVYNDPIQFTTYCGNIFTGKEKWSSYFADINENSIVDDTIIISSDLDSYIECRSIETNKLLWENYYVYATYFKEYKGIIYCINLYNNNFQGGTLCAIDALTGKVLWNLRTDANENFYKFTLIPSSDTSKGKIIAETSKAMYCYETIN